MNGGPVFTDDMFEAFVIGPDQENIMGEYCKSLTARRDLSIRGFQTGKLNLNFCAKSSILFLDHNSLQHAAKNEGR